MLESSEDVKTVVSIILLEHTLGLILHCVGLYLLRRAGKPTIGIILLIELIFAELCYISYDGILRAFHFITTGNIPFYDKKDQTICLFIYSVQFLTLIAITLDRLLIVKLGLRYKTLVTKRALAVAVSSIWIISLALALVMWFSQAIKFNQILVILECLLAVVYLCSYGYIIYALKLKQNRFRSDRNLNIKVPFLLVLTLICFYLIPELILAAGHPFSMWFLPFFNLNNVTDALIYIFGTPMCRKRLKTIFCNKRINPLTNQATGDGQVETST